MNSKWQIHRVGLLDFWYYDDEEFYFLDGRMLLRGANGSGKSVTMQSFIPLLLDGNMRPERLDPFGSRARKMENYLLEENDDREERTGYLYMELKRVKSDEFLTLGIGMRARKNKKLESWYFCLTDGRRIGKDFYLYKEGQSKIACTKLELRNRIGDGGRVMETQGEYAQCVNRLLFGFEMQEEYKELLELLIQLRTPKLSKDFKPTVINEILSSSLQTLSEDDLRPMSEAIENMDHLKTNLDTLDESIRAAKQIEKVYDQYNGIALYDKALLFMKSVEEYKSLRKRAEELQWEMNECERLREAEPHGRTRRNFNPHPSGGNGGISGKGLCGRLPATNRQKCRSDDRSLLRVLLQQGGPVHRLGRTSCGGSDGNVYEGADGVLRAAGGGTAQPCGGRIRGLCCGNAGLRLSAPGAVQAAGQQGTGHRL